MYNIIRFHAKYFFRIFYVSINFFHETVKPWARSFGPWAPTKTMCSPSPAHGFSLKTIQPIRSPHRYVVKQTKYTTIYSVRNSINCNLKLIIANHFKFSKESEHYAINFCHSKNCYFLYRREVPFTFVHVFITK